MYTIIFYFLTVIMIISVLHWVNFSKQEGKDERGKMILGQAAQIVYSVVVITFGLAIIVDRYITFTDEQFTNTVMLLMTLIMVTNSVTIAFLNRRY